MALPMPRWLVVYGAAQIGAAMINRSEVNRALAKAIAYHQCGQQQKAEAWAARLIKLLECASIIDPMYTKFAADRGIKAE